MKVLLVSARKVTYKNKLTIQNTCTHTSPKSPPFLPSAPPPHQLWGHLFFHKAYFSLAAYLLLCLWFFIAYTNYVWQSTGIMNSSRSACYLYKNKFIILISLLPKAYIVCHGAQNNLYFLALVLACRGNSTAISQSVRKSQMWIVIVKIETDDRSSHTLCIVSTHIFMLMDRRFQHFFLLLFLASSRRQHEKFANINSHEIKFVFIFPSLGSQCFFFSPAKASFFFMSSVIISARFEC